MILPIPKMYDEMPFPEGYFEEDIFQIPLYTIRYDYDTISEYAKTVHTKPFQN